MERRFYIALIFIKVDGADAVNGAEAVGAAGAAGAAGAVGAVGAVGAEAVGAEADAVGAEAADEHPQLVTLLPSKSSCFTRNSRPHLHLQSQ